MFRWEKDQEETDEMTEKEEPFEAKHQKEERLDEMPVPPKTLKSTSLTRHPHTHTHTHPHLFGFLN